MKNENENALSIYIGDGSTATERNFLVPPYKKPEYFDEPEYYFAGEGLRAAVNVALLLGQPLLITGEPGTGKTQLAASIAREFGFKLFKFHTKSNSTAKDLFYHYDALSHFHDAQFHRLPKPKSESLPAVEAHNPTGEQNLPSRIKEITAAPYITYEALGLAILLSLSPKSPERQRVNQYLPDKTSQVRSVVLIDEIDKAPRDFPNDILNEIEEMSFTVKEINSPLFKSPEEYRPIVILTSNSEKSLPDAFLRRCVFYYIDFPDTKTLTEIVNKRLGELDEESGSTASVARKNAIQLFEQIRTLNLRKKPATAELLNWLRILEKLEINPFQTSVEKENQLISTFSILLKNKEDIKTAVTALRSKFKNKEESDEEIESITEVNPNL